jgi:SUN domain-containing protein 1/2
VDDFITRLREVELALADMTRRHDQLQSLYDRERKVSSTSAQRISLLENKLETEMKSSAELIEGVRKTSLSQISGINDEIKILKESTSKPADTSKLEEAVATVRSRVDGVENTVKDVLEHVRSNPKTGSSSASSWWSTSSWKSGISIKTSDGKDVTALIASMVQSAIVQYSKDIVGKRDFALGSSGGKVIPTWTTSSYTHSPSSWSSAILGWPLGVGRTPGRPPVSALHHELSQGYCWPFAGSSGQLGVLLARQVYISEFTIDHIASELAFNLRSAPKDIEVWALVEGADNLAKYRTYQEVKKLQREREEQFAKDHGTAPPPPENVWNGAPKGTYMQIGNFTYDIHAPHHIQTFAVAPEIQAAGIDFGIVVFRFRSNWGDNRFTCIYRVRVHGVEANGPEPLLPPETEESS